MPRLDIGNCGQLFRKDSSGERCHGREARSRPDSPVRASAGFCKPGGTNEKRTWRGTRCLLRVRWSPQRTVAAVFQTQVTPISGLHNLLSGLLRAFLKRGSRRRCKIEHIRVDCLARSRDRYWIKKRTSVLCKQCVHIYRVAMSGVFLTMDHTLKSLRLRGLTGVGETSCCCHLGPR